MLLDAVSARSLPAGCGDGGEALGCSAGELELVRRRRRRAAMAGLPREAEFVAVREWGLMSAEESAVGDLLHLILPPRAG